MKIAGFVKESFVDYPKQIALVVFTNGCNMNCWYCHNHSLITGTFPCINEDEIFDYLNKRIGWIDAVVISGGEPTLQEDLICVIQKIKALGFLVKLDTNGTRPDVLKKIIDSKVVDFIAMDIKAPKTKLQQVAKAENMFDNMLQSIALIKQSGISYEFRTTVLPHFELKDLQEMAQMIAPAMSYALQKYRPISNAKMQSFAFTLNNQNLTEIKKILPNTFLRGF